MAQRKSGTARTGRTRQAYGAHVAGRDDAAERIRLAFERLLAEFGPQGWWPGDGPFEVMVGAVLTQNTSWKNVEHALRLLRDSGLLSVAALAEARLARLEALVRPAGSWRRKAATLKALAGWIESAGGLDAVLRMDRAELRKRLTGLHGVGPETADSIAVYAAGHPVFVVDAYARRFAGRHGVAPHDAPYSELQALFEGSLGHSADRLAECHALLVELGKRFCRPYPRCETCPLRNDLPEAELDSFQAS